MYAKYFIYSDCLLESCFSTIKSMLLLITAEQIQLLSNIVLAAQNTDRTKLNNKNLLLLPVAWKVFFLRYKHVVILQCPWTYLAMASSLHQWLLLFVGLLFNQSMVQWSSQKVGVQSWLLLTQLWRAAGSAKFGDQ